MARRLSRAMAAKLAMGIRQSRRRTLYRMLGKQHGGIVPCWVCNLHVALQDATLEHITPVSLGGTDDMDNLSISHAACNHARGNTVDNQHKKISGYRDLSQAEIDAMNKVKAKAEEVGHLLSELEAIPGVDKRWVSIAKTDLQQGFMSAVRAVAQPSTF